MINIRNIGLWKAKELINSNKKKFFYVFVADIVFFLVILFIRFFLLNRGLTPNDINNMGQPASIIFSFSYILFMLLFYSLMKYLVIIIIKSAEQRSEFRIKGMIKFVLLNALLAVIIAFALSIIMVFIGFAVKEDSIQAVHYVFFVLAALFSYLYINISHVLFAFSGRVMLSVIKPLKIIFTEGKLYIPVVINILFALLLYMIFVFPAMFAGAELLLMLKVIYYVLFAILFYVAIFLNRVQLFLKLTNFK